MLHWISYCFILILGILDKILIFYTNSTVVFLVMIKVSKLIDGYLSDMPSQINKI